jgi:hypothetical protein
MICRVVYILIMCHLSELGDAVKFLFVKKKTKRKKKKISYCTSLFIDVTKGSLHSCFSSHLTEIVHSTFTIV